MNTIDRSIHDLRNSDSFVRARAAEAIRLQGPPAKKAIPALIAALVDPSFIVCVASIKALGAIGPAAHSAVPKLIIALEDELLAVYASSALGRIGPAARAALPALRNLARGASDELQAPAVIAIHRIERTAQTKAAASSKLSAILAQGTDEETRACALVGLEELGVRARG